MSGHDRDGGCLQDADRAFQKVPTNEEILNSLLSEYKDIKRELNFLAAQCEGLFSELSRIIRGASFRCGSESVSSADCGREGNAAESMPPENSGLQKSAGTPYVIDYDLLAEKVAERIPACEYLSPELIASKTAEQILSSLPPFNSEESNGEAEGNSGEENTDIDEEADVKISAADFRNMMKYDRSFMARLIQSDDEKKELYGEVRTALLSYERVNQTYSWGSERFSLGRQTIARIKVRGKTLCLYLALDPSQYKTSVYHHADVSANKSVAGTPMMVKIKSPIGAKKAVRLISEMLEKSGVKQKNTVYGCDYVAAYPFETTEELIAEGLIKRAAGVRS